MKSRHEPVPQPEGQSASRPERLVTQPCPDCFSRPRASRSSSRGRGRRACLSVVCSLLLFSLLSFFRAVSQELSRSRVCAAATSAFRGVGRGGCAASPCIGKVLPDSRGQWHQEHRAPSQEPRNFSGILPQYVVRRWVLPFLFFWWDVLGLWFLAPPAVTSASEVLTQTHRSSGLFQWLACWAQNPKVCEVQSYMSACRIERQCRTWTCPLPESGGI